MLRDEFGREFHYLRLSITDVCNFRCSYCLPEGYQGRPDAAFLSLDEIRRVATAFAATGTRKIRITGGEPSVRADLPDIIRALKEIQDIDKVVITTNGYRLPERIDEWHRAGIDAVNLSIDSLDPAVFNTITGHDRLRELLEGLDRAIDLGIKTVKVNAVMLRGLNHHQLDQFLQWIKAMPITLRFIELMQTGDNEAFFKKHHFRGENIKQRLLAEGWREDPRDIDAGPAREYSHPEFRGRVGLIMPYSKDFCVTCNRLRVSSTGQLHLCLFSEHGISLRHLLHSDDQLPELLTFLRQQLGTKKISHFLQQGDSGGTEHLAMIGG